LGNILKHITIFLILLVYSLFMQDYKTASVVLALGLIASFMAQFPKNRFVRKLAEKIDFLK